MYGQDWILALFSFLHVYGPLLCLRPQTLKKNYKTDIHPSWPYVWSIAQYILEIQRLGINENNVFTCLAKPEHDLHATLYM